MGLNKQRANVGHQPRDIWATGRVFGLKWTSVRMRFGFDSHGVTKTPPRQRKAGWVAHFKIESGIGGAGQATRAARTRPEFREIPQRES